MEKSVWRGPLRTSSFYFPLPDGLYWMQTAELLEALYEQVLNCHLHSTKEEISLVCCAFEWHVAFDLLGLNAFR